MSSRAQSQRLATQLREYEITAREKFPTWDDNARSYYAELKDKDRNGTLVSGSLNHYLYHTHLHKLREDRLQTLKEKETPSLLSEKLGKEKASGHTAAGKALKPNAKAVSDIESSDDPSTHTVEPAPKKSVEARARRDNEGAADSPKKKRTKSSRANDKVAQDNDSKFLRCTSSIRKFRKFY